MVVPPKAAVQGEANILSRKAVGNGLSGNIEGSGGNNPGSCEENNLSFRRIKGEATRRAPSDKTVDCALNLSEENVRV